MKRRTTQQLAATYDVLAASSDHPTAEQILARVRRRIPRVSLGTVYRNLDKLREQGRARVVRVASGVSHFDAVVDAHDHFVCEACGAVSDLPAPSRSRKSRSAERAGCVVHWQTTAVYGLCRVCVRSARTESGQPPA